jgi:PAS domain S-box-containing protein
MTAESAALILNVDDNPGVLYARTRILRRAGFRVMEANCGEEALALAETIVPTLVLLDVQLPDLSGIEVCRRIRQMPANARTPVLHISSTFSQQEVQAASADSGADIYLVEPVGPEELTTVVRTLLRLRSTEIVLAESEARLWLAADAAEIATWEIDVVTGAATWSPRLYALLGRPANGGLTSWQAWRELIHPDDVEAVDRSLAVAKADGHPFRCEHRVRGTDDGHERWMSLNGRLFPDKDGQLTRMIGVAVDITNRRQVDAAREQMLAHAERARREAEDAARQKDEFLATLAHELRNPLAPMRNALEILRLAAPREPRVEFAREMMQRQLGQMVRLIDDLLDVSRITRGKLELRPERVQLATVLDDAVEASRPAIEAAHHVLTVTLPEAPVVLDADPVRLAQVFSNLLNNASKYMDPGGRIDVRVEAGDDSVAVAVRDAGIGIPAESLSRIFEMFSQIDRSLDRSQGGLGIGLTLVQRLVEMHGGDVSVSSDGPGRGSEFVVRLPLAAQAGVARRADAAVADPGPNDSARCRVLVADDNRDAADSLGQMLALLGHDVDLAYDGLRAYALAEQRCPDIAILDIGMPLIHGYDLARRLRATEWGRRMTLVALSGWGQDDDKRRALEAGFDHHFTKPMDLPALVNLLKPGTPPRPASD